MGAANDALPREASLARAQRLSPMFEAKRIAVVGASQREGSFGLRLAQAVTSAGFAGQIDFVNPKQRTILGLPSRPSIAELDQTPDLLVLGVGPNNLESALTAGIRRGARSAVIFDSCFGTTESGQPLVARLKDIAREADIPICGGNGMGFINVLSRCVASFYPAAHLKAGGISLIAHSGSIFTTLAMNDTRYRFDLIVSCGQEIGATLDEYIDYAAARKTTKAIAVFMETARNPMGFVRALENARELEVPVIVCKVGRSDESARMARSHTGALAGSRAAYDAAFAKCGAIAVDTIDQLMNVAALCAVGRRPASGGLGLVTDSGGLRELAMDCAAEMGSPLAKLTAETLASLRNVLPADLEPSNPLDCAGALTEDFASVFRGGLTVMDRAGEISMIGFEADLRDDYVYMQELLDLARDLPKITRKPCFFYSSFGRAHTRSLADNLADYGVPCINGIAEVLFAAKKVQYWSTNLTQAKDAALTQSDPVVVDRWRSQLASRSGMNEQASLALLSDFGVPSVESRTFESEAAVAAAAPSLKFPVVLKTAEPGIDHKSDVNGVVLNLHDAAALQSAYGDLSRRLGRRVIVQSQLEKGVELAFGCIVDRDFGPLVMVSAGGVLIELFEHREFALAPVSERTALRMIQSLPAAKLLDGVRGAKAVDKRGAAKAFAAFSCMCAALADQVAEIDVNPVVVTVTGATAVDALITLSFILQNETFRLP